MDTSIPGKKACTAQLPYPADERLVWVVTCKVCGLTVGITAAGRPDDPRSIRMTCKEPLQ